MSRAAAGGTHSPNDRRVRDGVLLLDKDPGITSHRAVQSVRRLLGAARGGHTGTLDPLATGLLPVCLGEATKFSHTLLDADKSYLARVRLGMTTATGDLEGAVTSRTAVAVSRPEVESVLAQFRGDIRQIPPMYSAAKVDGTPLYKHARAGRELARAARLVTIRSLAPVDFDGEVLTVRLTCSKGTYVRVLAEDIGRVLGCGACLEALRREAVGAFDLSGAVTLAQLEAMATADRPRVLLPVDALVASLPRLDLDESETRRLTQGQAVERPDARALGLARIYGPGAQFLGVAEITEPGRLVARRLRSQAQGGGRATASIA